MSDQESRIRAALADEKLQPGELHDAAIRRAMRATSAQLAASASPRRSQRRFVYAGVAAGVVLLFGAAFLVQMMRGIDDHDVVRGGTADSSGLLPAADAELAARPAEFRWPAQPGATTYLLTLRDGAGVVLWRSEPIGSTQVAVPADVAVRLTAGDLYLWSVTVSGQAETSQLGPYAFRVHGR